MQVAIEYFFTHCIPPITLHLLFCIQPRQKEEPCINIIIEKHYGNIGANRQENETSIAYNFTEYTLVNTAV